MDVSLKQVALPALAWLLGLGLFGGMGCSTIGGDDPPLPDSTFTRVLIDLHMTRARGKRFTRTPAAVTDSVFARHDVGRAAFDATLEYYARHPDAFSSLYDAVIDSLNALRSRPWARSSSGSDEAPPQSDRERPSLP
jgi:hypothetical protein